MLCNECNEREATIHLTQIMGDQMAKRDLCVVCGKEYLDPTKSFPLDQWMSSAVPSLNSLAPRLEELVARDSRYAREAYLLVLEGLTSVRRMFWEPGTSGHISSAQLLEGLREQAIEMHGKKAKSRLNAWGVFKCEDFGEIVFNLVEAGLMVKSAEDDKKDFQNGFDFDTAFPS
jgi:uncharacterized repeat protein (TIGR04138 family)